MKTLNPSEVDFDAYFQDQQLDAAKVKPASSFVDAVIDRFHGEGQAANWTPTGFDKMRDKFDLRPGEVTVWAGINKHGKTTFLSHVMLNLMQQGEGLRSVDGDAPQRQHGEDDHAGCGHREPVHFLHPRFSQVDGWAAVDL